MSGLSVIPQQGLVALPDHALGLIAAQLSTTEKVCLASSCRRLWQIGGLSSSWWHSMSLDLASDGMLDKVAAWLQPRRDRVKEIELCITEECSEEGACAFLRALEGWQLVSLKWDVGASFSDRLFGLEADRLQQWSALQTLQLSCDLPYWDYGAFHNGEDPEPGDDGTVLTIDSAFSRLTALTSLTVSRFSSLAWTRACLPSGLRSLSVAICPAMGEREMAAAGRTVRMIANAADRVTALLSFSLVVEDPAAEHHITMGDDNLGLELEALGAPWARQLTQLSLSGPGRYVVLEPLAGLTTLQQLALRAEYVCVEAGRLGIGAAAESKKPLAPLGNLTQLRKVQLQDLRGLEIGGLQPVWSLPTLEEVDVAGLHMPLCTAPRDMLRGCMARRLAVSLRVAELLHPRLRPLEQLECLTVTDTESGYLFGRLEASQAPPAVVLGLLASHCYKLRTVEWVVSWPVTSPQGRQLFRDLAAALPANVELVAKVVRVKEQSCSVFERF